MPVKAMMYRRTTMFVVVQGVASSVAYRIAFNMR